MKANKSTTKPAAKTTTAKGTKPNKTSVKPATLDHKEAAAAGVTLYPDEVGLAGFEALNHNGTSLGKFATEKEAKAEARKYAKATGNAASVAPVADAPAMPVKPDTVENTVAPELNKAKGKVAPAPVAPAPVETVAPATAIPMLRKSLVKTPVFASWEMFDAMRFAALGSGTPLRRKDAVAAAVASGIAFYTARTQYQSWKTANNF